MGDPPRLFTAPAPMSVPSRQCTALQDAVSVSKPLLHLDRWGQQLEAMDSIEAAAGTEEGASLNAAERFDLASRAITSDQEYRKLLEVNKREIREERVGGGHNEQPRFVGWGLWTTK